VYVLRGRLNFILPLVHSRKKSFCVSIQGVKLWNNLNEKLISFKLFHSFTPCMGDTPLFLEIGSFYNPRVKMLSFTFFESIQPISGSDGTTFSIA